MPRCSNYHPETDTNFTTARTACKHSYEFPLFRTFQSDGHLTKGQLRQPQQLKIKISGIKCEKWMQFFVRFQSANAITKTQRGVGGNATVTC